MRSRAFIRAFKLGFQGIPANEEDEIRRHFPSLTMPISLQCELAIFSTRYAAATAVKNCSKVCPLALPTGSNGILARCPS